jgi:MarR family transcriptional regulator for hemolysin
MGRAIPSAWLFFQLLYTMALVRQAAAAERGSIWRVPKTNWNDLAVWAKRYGDFYPIGKRKDLEFRFTRSLIFAARRWTTLSEETVKAATGQSRARWQTLFSIAFTDERTTTLQLAERLGVQWPTLVRTLNGLEQDGLIRRTDNPDDRRSRLIEITPEGRRMIADVQPVLDPTRAGALTALSDRQLAEIVELLDQIARPDNGHPAADPA